MRLDEFLIQEKTVKNGAHAQGYWWYDRIFINTLLVKSPWTVLTPGDVVVLHPYDTNTRKDMPIIEKIYKGQ